MKIGVKARAISGVLSILCATSLISGCAEFDSIHDEYGVSKHGKVLTVDAKQRHLIMMPDNDGKPLLRVCAEATPDVFSAYAASGSANGRKDATGFSIQLGGSSAETASTIERTQTINLLRESMYRTCERYASGAINRTQLVIQAARDQRVMVAVLAIEQLTGALRPKSTIISGPDTSANVVAGDQAAKLINDAKANVQTASDAADAAKKAVSDSAACKPSTADSSKATEPATCDSLKTTATSTQTALASANDGLASTYKVAASLVTTVSSGTSGGTNAQGGEITKSEVDYGALAIVADKIEKIQRESQIDEALMFCIGLLTDPDARSNAKAYDNKGRVTQTTFNAPADGDITKNCTKIVLDRASNDEQIHDAVYSQLIKSEVQDTATIDNSAYDAFLKRLIGIISKISDTSLQNKLQNFTIFSKSTMSIMSHCRTTIECISWLSDPKNRAFRSDFDRNLGFKKQIEAALTDLSKN